MNDNICKECNEIFDDAEQVRRHLRKHGMTFQEYSLKWIHDNIVPTCKCGCNSQTRWNVALKAYAKFVHGHHAWGRKKSDDEKRRIGEKNSINMKRYMTLNPNIAILRNKQMRECHTPEIELRRIEATRRAYASMSAEDKKCFRDKMQKRWDDGQMFEAREKAAITFRKRSTAGEYDFTERNQKLSEAITRKYVEGSFEWSRGKHTSTKTGRTCYYRSSWELTLMKQLDADPDVVDWDSEFTSIPYQFEGSVHRYVPDFKVIRHSNTQLVEVKPQALRIIPRNVAKRSAAIAHCESMGWEYVEWKPIIDDMS